MLPEFKERDEAQVSAKAKRLEPVIEAALARKDATRPTLPEGYSFPAMPRKMVDASGNEQAKEWLEKFAESSATGDTAAFDQITQ